MILKINKYTRANEYCVHPKEDENCSIVRHLKRQLSNKKYFHAVNSEMSLLPCLLAKLFNKCATLNNDDDV